MEQSHTFTLLSWPRLRTSLGLGPNGKISLPDRPLSLQGEVSLVGLQMVAFSLCSHGCPSLYICWEFCVSFFDQNDISDSGFPLITSLTALPTINTVRTQSFSVRIFWGHSQSITILCPHYYIQVNDSDQVIHYFHKENYYTFLRNTLRTMLKKYCNMRC